MKKNIIFFLIFISQIANAQYGNYYQYNFFEHLLASRTKNNIVHSIDSITKSKYLQGDSLKSVFIAQDRDENYNVTEAKVFQASEDYLNGNNDYWDKVSVTYTDDNLFKSYAYIHEFYDRYDTMRYKEYDDNRNLILSIRSDEMDCITGSPPSANRTKNFYNENNQKTKSTIQVKWEYYCTGRPLHQWVNSYNIDYIYENNNLIEEYHTNVNLYPDPYEDNDTFDLTLRPFRKVLYSYYDDDRLKTYTYNYWYDKQNKWTTHYKDQYTYSGDTTIKRRKYWKIDTQSWDSLYIIKTWIVNGHTQEIYLKWNADKAKWLFAKYKYYVPSEVPGNYDEIIEIPDTTTNGRKIATTRKFYYQNDTTVLEYISFLSPNSSLKRYYLYDDRKNLKEYISFNHLSGKWEISEKSSFEYDQYDNRIKSIQQYKKFKVVTNYYWHHYFTGDYHPLLDPNNQWNIGFWQMLSPDTDSKRYKFSPDATLIDGKYYYQLQYSGSETGDDWQGDSQFFREDSQKVWVYDNGTERLLYDFALEKGDTIRTGDQNGIFLIVADTDSIELLNGEKRKAIRLYCSNETDTVNYSWYGLRTWIEGIGYLSGILTENSYCRTDNTNTLLCFYNNGEMLYSNPAHTYCWTAGTEDFPEEEAIIFPNPADDYLQIITDKDVDKTIIYNNTGNKIQVSENNTLNIENLKSGMYFVKILFESGKISNYKFIKN